MLNDYIHPTLVFDKPDEGGAGSDDSPDGGGEEGKTGQGLESIDEYKSALKSAREEAKSRREKNSDLQSQIDELSGMKEKFEKFQSFFDGDDEVDPQAIQQEKQSLQTELARERTKNKVTLAAMASGAEPDLTIAYLQMAGKLDDLADADEKAIKKAIDQALEEKPGLAKSGKAVTTGDSTKDSSNGTTDVNSWMRKALSK